MKKGIYLAAFEDEHLGHDIVYQDINGKRDIGGDMLEVDLTQYDFIIASPPCNYYSRANYRRETSEYSILTRHLLPGILDKLVKLNKPFIVENVRNSVIMSRLKLYDYPLFIYEIGRHTYWSNVFLNSQFIPQVKENVKYVSSAKRQGGINVHNVIEVFLETIGA